jgi:hypothetical protein
MTNADAADSDARFKLGTATVARALELDDLEMLHHAALVLKSAVDTTPADSPEWHRRLAVLASTLFVLGSEALGRVLRYGDDSMLNRAVSALQSAAVITPTDSPELHRRLVFLASALSNRF